MRLLPHASISRSDKVVDLRWLAANYASHLRKQVKALRALFLAQRRRCSFLERSWLYGLLRAF